MNQLENGNAMNAIRFLTIGGLFLLLSMKPAGFLEDQLKYPRVRTAQKEKQKDIELDLQKKGLHSANFEMLILAFKQEDELSVFVRKKGTKKYQLLRSFEICAKSGGLGPKKQQGDGQVPEGFYQIDRFNPSSNFYLSLGINYPNAADKLRNPSRNPGGDIFIHGSCVTIGCLPMTDPIIKEIYLLAVHAKNNGQAHIPVYIFPFKMTDANMKANEGYFKTQPDLKDFWSRLKVGYDTFYSNLEPLNVSHDAKGIYVF
ncbi:MAG: L,D-transpeptidase family protein [Bacteroidota bacterium]|nr:L,D-transpeptidase family protein [Bacteroidota bacterium]MDX5430317.1 L,D-transpeptidase family protein [Bacteroidota bacterium]MDX5469078.1 L,D-transpeptidase family protein [Bacteroidota bacterium]